MGIPQGGLKGLVPAILAQHGTFSLAGSGRDPMLLSKVELTSPACQLESTLPTDPLNYEQSQHKQAKQCHCLNMENKDPS